MAKGQVEVRRIKTADDRGNEVVIIEFRLTDLRRTVNGKPIDVAPRFPVFELVDGEPVNRRENGIYEVVRTGQILQEIV